MSLKTAFISALTKPGYELRKHQVQRWLQRRGLHMEIAWHSKFSYDACNYQDVPADDDAVIFDVGGNIGQSAVWFSESFPRAAIYSFEPFPAVYERLKMGIVGRNRINCFQTAIGSIDGRMEVPKVEDPFYQRGQIVPVPANESKKETVNVRRLDSFCAEHRISQIHILKTDTEGHDLEVFRGAKNLLESRRIKNIMTEASIAEGDCQHGSLWELAEHLRQYSFKLHGIYDLHHGRENGRLEYFNAIFQLSVDQPAANVQKH
jgi:FkbM family methyltransferase